VQRSEDECDMRRFKSFNHSMCKTVLNLLEAVYLRFWKIVVERVTVVKFRVDNRGSDDTGCFRTHLVSDAESNNADTHPLDCYNFIMQFIRIICRYTVSDEHDDTINVRSLFVIRIKHFEPCYLQTARRIRVLAAIFDSVHGRQHFAFRAIFL